MAAIDCINGGNNTGTPCVPLIKVQKRFILVDTFDSTGTANEIDSTATLNKAYFDARVNDPDPTKRWYPLPEIKNITDARDAAKYDTALDGTKFFIQDGIRTKEGFVFASDAPPQLVGKINSHRGTGKSIFAIDKENNIIGKVGSTSAMLAPIKIESDSLYAMFMPSTDSEIQKIKVSFDVSIDEDDSEIRMIKASNMSYNPSLLRGLYDVTLTVASITTTGFSVTAVTDGGSIGDPVVVEGLVAADFVSSVTDTASKIRNTTDAADVTVTVTESPAGTYAVSYTAQTSGDDLTLKIQKDGFAFTETPVAIP